MDLPAKYEKTPIFCCSNNAGNRMKTWIPTKIWMKIDRKSANDLRISDIVSFSPNAGSYVPGADGK